MKESPIETCARCDGDGCDNCFACPSCHEVPKPQSSDRDPTRVCAFCNGWSDMGVVLSGQPACLPCYQEGGR